MSSTPPKYITGGCLCGAIRYRADFPLDHDFEKMSSICMCTQCRKQSGSLILHFHVVPLSSFHWMKPRASGEGALSHTSQPPNTNDPVEHSNTDLVPHDMNNPDKLPSALGDYQATPGNHRYFCKVCGGLTVWFGPQMGTPKNSDDEIEICAGSIDEEFLIGRKDEHGELLSKTKSTSTSTSAEVTDEEKGYGTWLCHPECRVVWAQNEILGVTDQVGCKREGGNRWKFGTQKGVRAGE